MWFGTPSHCATTKYVLRWLIANCIRFRCCSIRSRKPNRIVFLAEKNITCRQDANKLVLGLVLYSTKQTALWWLLVEVWNFFCSFSYYSIYYIFSISEEGKQNFIKQHNKLPDLDNCICKKDFVGFSKKRFVRKVFTYCCIKIKIVTYFDTIFLF